MPKRLCSTASCSDEATYRGRCATHAQQRNKDTHRNRSVYNSKRWKILRRMVLFNHPLCECGAVSTDVDHIRPIEQGGEVWVQSNLQSMCAACHGRKTNREMRAT